MQEVEKYINLHKHLPDVPTAKEIEENGLNLGEMNAVLLKKIEELTLCIIEINKQMELLKAQNEILKMEMSKFQKSKQMSRIILVLVTIMAIVGGCKKYEEGPLISFRGPVHRIIGHYAVNGFFVNNVDKLQTYYDSCNCKFRFHSEYSIITLYGCRPKVDNANDTILNEIHGGYKLKDNDRHLIMSLGSSKTVRVFRPFIDGATLIWEIKKLRNKKMILETVFMDDVYRISLIE